MKYIWSLLVFGIVCFWGVLPPSGETAEVAKQTVSCKVELDKNLFEVGEPIHFNYRCWSEDGNDFELSNGFVYFTHNFGAGLDVEQDNGKKYRFYTPPDLIMPGLMGRHAYANKDLVFTFPDGNVSVVRFFENIAWAEFQKSSENLDRDAQQKLFGKKGPLQIPVGKYFVFLQREGFPEWIDKDPILRFQFVETKIPFEVTESTEKKYVD